MNQQSHSYRPDIDGLRAIAVLAVLGFHASPTRIQGGFVGVDVFFVISGFLITGIILNDFRHGGFSFLNFYLRRIRRIFPALVLVLLTCLVAGWLILLPHDFALIGKHVLAGSMFVSNIVLFFDASYFNSDATYKPLLHLWSLGVEEQYYLFWPALLFLVQGRRSRALWMIIGIGLGSFALNIVLIESSPEAAFYMPVTRFWELMLGSALAVLADNSDVSKRSVDRFTVGHRAIVAWVGAASIATAIVVLDPVTPFPGWWALPVAGGTTLIILAGKNAWLNRILFSWKPLVRVGLISYPLYLWHWPLLSFASIVYGAEPPFLVRAMLVAASFILAFLTYRFIEIPVRSKLPRAQTLVVVGVLTMSIAILGVTGLMGYMGVIRSAAASDPQILAISEAVLNGTDPEGGTILGNAQGVTLFIGDSYVAQYRPRFEMLAAKKDFVMMTAEFRTSGGCPPIRGIALRSRPHCYPAMIAAYKRATDPDVDTVVIGSDWRRLENVTDFYGLAGEAKYPHQLSSAEIDQVLTEFSSTLEMLQKKGKRIFVLLSTVGGDPFDPRHMVDRSGVIPVAHYRSYVPRDEAIQYSRHIVAKVRQAALNAGVIVLDPSEWVCHNDVCPTVDSDRRPISADGYHLRPEFVRENLAALDELVKAQKQKVSSVSFTGQSDSSHYKVRHYVR